MTTISKQRATVIPFGSLPKSKNTKEKLLDLWLALSELQRQQKFVDSASAARLVGVSQRTIRHWIDAGRILAVHVGKRHRIYLDSLKGHLAKQIPE